MILADTSVWIDHLRAGEPLLAELLDTNRVLVYPLIIGELACGNLNSRKTVLSLLRKLPTVRLAIPLAGRNRSPSQRRWLRRHGA